ncbi:GtrA family protein [Candidatus Saccharibacteria bacterium]|nr:GtrA family protein [Candidatus Saccharibacteria bacterium]MCB9834801.1 GtrA family protein [Candidatus Nomurabacteria bacterium]
MVSNTFWQAVKFGIVGASNTIIDFGFYNLILHFTDLGVNQAALISGTIALVNSLILNSKVTFKSKIDRSISIKFIGATLIGLFIVRNFTLWILVHTSLIRDLANWFVNLINLQINLDWLVNNTNLAIATVALMVWNFVIYKYYVYKK